MNILKVKDLYNTSLLLFVHAYLQGDCPAAVKNYFVRRNSVYNTRQMGHLEYRRARLDLGTSRVQYLAAELWNLLRNVIKNIPCRKYFKRNLCEKLVQGYSEYFLQGDAIVTRVAKVHKLQPTMIIFCTNLKLFLDTVIVVKFCIFLYN